MWNVERTIRGVDPSREELLPYVGPAAALPLFGALARLGHPLAVQVWTALLAAALLALVLALLALARERRRDAAFAALLFAVVNGASTSAIALGQSALLAVAGIALALLAFERRSIAGGALATLLAALQPNLAIALLARLRDRVAVVSVALAAAAFAALTLAAGVGFAGFAAYLRRLGSHGEAERFTAIQHTPAAVLWSLGIPPDAAYVAGLAVAGAAVAVVVLATVRARLDARASTLLALALLPCTIPFVHEHDFTIALVPLTLLALSARGAVRTAAGAAAILLLVDWFGLAQRPAAQPQILAQGVAVACAYAALGPGSRLQRADLLPFAVLAFCACAALPLAHAFPAGTWPDALPPHYAAPSAADASAVWADEQRAAGLTARVPAWGALRAIPLAGTIVLAVAIVLAARKSP